MVAALEKLQDRIRLVQQLFRWVVRLGPSAILTFPGLVAVLERIRLLQQLCRWVAGVPR